MSIASSSIRNGSYTGAGAALNVAVGFVPKRVDIFNVTDGTVVATGLLDPDGGADKTIYTNAAAGPVSGAGNTAITSFKGSASAGAGFSVGSSLAANGKEYRWTAYR